MYFLQLQRVILLEEETKAEAVWLILCSVLNRNIAKAFRFVGQSADE